MINTNQKSTDVPAEDNSGQNTRKVWNAPEIRWLDVSGHTKNSSAGGDDGLGGGS